MLRASFKSLLARKLRLFMSATAIILGVAFVSGSLIFTDTLGKAFDGIMTGSVGDVIVRPEGGSGNDMTQTSRTIPGSVVAEVAKAQGAARADGNVGKFGVFVVGKNRKVIGAMGAPGIAANINDAPSANDEAMVEILQGREPTGAGEVMLDRRTAEVGQYRVGDEVLMVTSGKQPTLKAKLVGTFRYGSGGLAGASLSVFETKTAQDLFFEGKDTYTDVWVTAQAGVSSETLRSNVAALLPDGYEAVTGKTAADEAASDINEALSFITIFLLVFAAIALFVGSFLIINTFSILVAQRSRELALLRAVGAQRGQVTRSVLLEALIVSLVGSTVGLGLGFVLAIGIKALFATFGLDLSETGLAFEPTTPLAAFGVGMVVTLLAAYLPARRAGRVPPVAAMRDDLSLDATAMRLRTAGGIALVAVGAVVLGLGLFAEVPNQLWWIGAGIFGVLLGTALTSPLLGRPVIATLGALYRRAFGAVGLMAEQNAIRNPRRTAATASALMIGLTLVSMMTVFGASAKASVDKTIEQNFAADYVVSNAVGTPFSTTVTDQVRDVPGVKVVAPFRYVMATPKGGDDEFSGGLDPASFAQVTTVDMVSGRLTSLDDAGVLVAEDVSPRPKVGDRVEFGLAGEKVTKTVRGVYEPNGALTGMAYLFTNGALEAAGVEPADSMAFVVREPGSSVAALEAGVNKVIKDLPTVTLKDQAEFAAEQRKPIDQMLTIIYALLGLAVVIAILGIINTLALSVLERTREIGLLRAVGLSRRQLRGMVILEAVVISLLGAVLGLGLGIVFGVALQRALVGEGIEVLAIPVPQLVVFMVLAAVVGVLAALWPALRASRIDVLRAITTE